MSEHAEEDDVTSLVRLAGPRAMPAEAGLRAARAHVHGAWRAGVRRRRGRIALVSAAAGLAAVAGAFALTARYDVPRATAIAPAQTIARLDLGEAERANGSGWVPLV